MSGQFSASCESPLSFLGIRIEGALASTAAPPHLVHLDGDARSALVPAVVALVPARVREEVLDVNLADLLGAGGVLFQSALHDVRILLRLLVAVRHESVVVCKRMDTLYIRDRRLGLASASEERYPHNFVFGWLKAK